jgi:membrane fusion protein (multidrug efflux system)
MPMLKRLLLVLLALAVAFGGIFGWKYYQGLQYAARASIPPPPATVASAEVRSETWQPYMHAVGSLVAVQGIDVTNEVAGQVKQIQFQSGQGVQQGELLLQLDDSVDQAELQGLIAERHLAQLQYQRSAELLPKKTVSREAYDEAKAKLESAEAQVASKQALIQKKKIRAPFSGLLGIRLVDLGQYLAPGSRIVPLQIVNPIYVDYALPEHYFAQLAPKQKVVVTVRAYPQRDFEGHISAINPGIDPGTRNVRVRAMLENPEGLLRPGMFAEVRTALPERTGVLTLPRTAISYNPYGEFVFVIEQQDDKLIVKRRQVRTGEAREERVEILDGLKLGERVVAAGQVKLRNGQPVQIDDSIKLDKPASES